MKTPLFRLVFGLLLAFLVLKGPLVSSAFAQEEGEIDHYYTAKVTAIVKESLVDEQGHPHPSQTLELAILEGSLRGQAITVDYGNLEGLQVRQLLKKGDKVILVAAQVPGRGTVYRINEPYRLPSLLFFFVLFVAFAFVFGGLRGLTSVAGMLFGLFVLVQFVIPQILNGANPLLMSLLGSFFIGLVSIYLAHGFNRRTSIALLSTFLVLGIAAFLAWWAVGMTHLSGTAQEEVWFLQLEGFENIDLHGLLLGGILIGVLGVLDDVTTTQVALVDELKKANPRFTFVDLYKKGLSVGREHIASLVNTLLLAYVGASFALVLLLSVDSSEPFWVTLNSEFLAEEIVRTLVGSLALVLAVPLSTFLAAAFFNQHPSMASKDPPHPIHR